jgi:hypothetical protein
MARTSGLNSFTPTRSSLFRRKQQRGDANASSDVQNFVGLMRARQIILFKKSMAEGREQCHLVAGFEFRHQARAASHDFVEKLESARRRGPPRAGLAALRRLDVKDAHGPAQQHVGPSENAHHRELARPRSRRLPRSIQTQKEMAAGEGTILDDSHSFVVHRNYGST